MLEIKTAGASWWKYLALHVPFQKRSPKARKRPITTTTVKVILFQVSYPFFFFDNIPHQSHINILPCNKNLQPLGTTDVGVAGQCCPCATLTNVQKLKQNKVLSLYYKVKERRKEKKSVFDSKFRNTWGYAFPSREHLLRLKPRSNFSLA